MISAFVRPRAASMVFECMVLACETATQPRKNKDAIIKFGFFINPPKNQVGKQRQTREQANLRLSAQERWFLGERWAAISLRGSLGGNCAAPAQLRTDEAVALPGGNRSGRFAERNKLKLHEHPHPASGRQRCQFSFTIAVRSRRSEEHTSELQSRP